MRRKTPKEKKNLDYDKQRRTHWDSQKAARKAIPRAKRAARQIIRKRSNEMISAALGDEETAPTASELAEVERMNRFEPYGGRRETLREHLKHTQQKRSRNKNS